MMLNPNRRFPYHLLAVSTLVAPSAAQFTSPEWVNEGAAGAASVELADVTGDGAPDLIAVGELEGAVVWYENLGAGLMGARQVIDSGLAGARALVAADLDGDGDLDLAVASYFSNRITWYENLGGAFGSRRLVTAALDYGTDVDAADLDGDGDLDLLSASRLDHTIAWYENDGLGAFGAARVISGSALRAMSVATGDLDGDGHVDVVSASSRDDRVTWYRNNGVGVFGPGVDLTSSADRAQDVEVADLDGDGNLDVISASEGDGRVLWFRNNGAGVFAPAVELAQGVAGAADVAVADVSLDGAPDVLFAASGAGEFRYVRNLLGGQFAASEPLATGLPGARGVALGDVDGDGKIDAALAVVDTGQVGTAINIFEPDCNGNGIPDPQDISLGTSSDCNGNLIPDECDLLSGLETDCNGNGVVDSCELALAPSFDTGVPVSPTALGAPWSVATADVDQDGDRDLVVGARSDNSVLWYRNLGMGAYGPAQPISVTATGVFDVLAADIDGDGDDDVVAANSFDDEFVWYENLGGSFGATRVIGAGADGARTVDAKDVDGDGDLDVIVGSFNDDTVGWYSNLGGGVFGARRILTQQADFVLCVFGLDIDADGDMDVISASRDDNSIRVYENLIGGNAWTTHVVATTDAPNFVRAGDLDGDGLPDLAFSSAGNDAVLWSRGLGVASTFASPTAIFTSVANPSNVLLADLDVDGDLDVAITSYGTDLGQGLPPNGRVAWVEGNGAGQFSPEVVLSNNLDRASFLAAGDLDGDFYPELICSTWRSGSVLVYTNLIGSPVTADCDGNGQLDTCQIDADPGQDLDGNGRLDSCEAIGSTFCSPAISNSTGSGAEVTLLGSPVVFLNDLQLTARLLPQNSFGFFITSRTPGFAFPVGGSQGALCVLGAVGRYVGPGQIVNAGSAGAFSLDVSLLQMPTPTGSASALPGETWHFQAWYRDANPSLTSNFTDAVALTLQ